MVSIMEIMQLCRLCLVKEQVNIPIFEDQGDIRQIFFKITACLPVKISKEDKLPKKICDGCLYKLELLYQFWNTTANAEKQLLSWIEQTNMDVNSKSVVEPLPQSQPQLHTVKQEKIEPAESTNESVDLSTDTQSYILQQQQLPYQTDYQFKESQGSNVDGMDTSENSDEPLSKRRRRRQATKPIPPESLDSSENEGGDSLLEMAVTKTEEESESEGEGEENIDDPEPTKLEAVGTEDSEQPGPSGLGKGGTEAPFDHLELEEDFNLNGYECELCAHIFLSKNDFLSHHMKDDSINLVCCNCEMKFGTIADLFQHKQAHRVEQVVIEQAEIQFSEYTEEVEAVLNIPSDESAIGSTSELLYILDDSQCVNEVIIEETDSHYKNNKQDNFSVVQVDHGYMIPSVFKGQLETRKRVKKKDCQSDSDDAESKNLLIQVKPSTSKRVITPPKVRQLPVRKRHDLPDFSASDYVVLNPNDEVDMMHYKCLRCEQLFINKFVFFRHIEKGKCYVNSCDVCSADFEKNSDFYEHYIVEHTDRAICNFCFRTFMYEKNVKEHMLRHLDQFRHRCEECNKGFYTIREYRNHYKNRHMGIRHRCEDCGRSFADEYYFKRHIATHIKKTMDKQSSS